RTSARLPIIDRPKTHHKKRPLFAAFFMARTTKSIEVQGVGGFLPAAFFLLIKTRFATVFQYHHAFKIIANHHDGGTNSLAGRFVFFVLEAAAGTKFGKT